MVGVKVMHVRVNRHSYFYIDSENVRKMGFTVGDRVIADLSVSGIQFSLQLPNEHYPEEDIYTLRPVNKNAGALQFSIYELADRFREIYDMDKGTIVFGEPEHGAFPVQRVVIDQGGPYRMYYPSEKGAEVETFDKLRVENKVLELHEKKQELKRLLGSVRQLALETGASLFTEGGVVYARIQEIL
jgi:hypothetical protein